MSQGHRGSGSLVELNSMAEAMDSGNTRHIFVTGGVASSLGKGLTASSLGNLLRALSLIHI